MAIFKGLYRGNGIYWHGKHGYGDETTAYTHTMAEYKARIDARIQRDLESRPDCDKYWDTLSHEERTLWRRHVWDGAINPAQLSASELAYNAHKKA